MDQPIENEGLQNNPGCLLRAMLPLPIHSSFAFSTFLLFPKHSYRR